jgi:hypothetical protein
MKGAGLPAPPAALPQGSGRDGPATQLGGSPGMDGDLRRILRVGIIPPSEVAPSPDRPGCIDAAIGGLNPVNLARCGVPSRSTNGSSMVG